MGPYGAGRGIASSMTRSMGMKLGDGVTRASCDAVLQHSITNLEKCGCRSTVKTDKGKSKTLKETSSPWFTHNGEKRAITG
ncbi:hypothetical protein Tco_1174432 [Tanacetum coccineum]